MNMVSNKNCASSYRRALVVDDSPVIRKIHTRILERLGFDVVSVNDGLQALTALGQGQFELVLMDCEMPIMDGITATKTLRIREQSNLEKTTIIAVTSSGMDEECVEAGMNAFLVKPLRTDTLATALKFLSQSHSQSFPIEQLVAS